MRASWQPVRNPVRDVVLTKTSLLRLVVATYLALALLSIMAVAAFAFSGVDWSAIPLPCH